MPRCWQLCDAENCVVKRAVLPKVHRNTGKCCIAIRTIWACLSATVEYCTKSPRIRRGTSRGLANLTRRVDTRRLSNPLDLILAAIGTVLMGVAVFLPRWETTSLSGIAKNTLIQGNGGIGVLVAALLIALALYDIYNRGTASWWLAILGAGSLGWIVYNGLHKAYNTLYPIGVNGQLDTSSPIHATPGTGMWMAGVGAALVLFAGLHTMFYGPKEQQVEDEPVEAAPELGSADRPLLVDQAAARLPGESDKDCFRR